MMTFAQKMNRRFQLIAVLLAGILILAVEISVSFAEWDGPQKLISLNRKANVLELVCLTKTGRKLPVRVQVVSPDVIRVSWFPSGKITPSPLERYGIVQNNDAPVSFRVSEEKDAYFVKTAELEVRLQKEPFRVAFFDQKHALLTGEATSGMGFNPQTGRILERLRLFPNDHFYGSNARFGPPLDMRGDTILVRVGRAGHKSQNRIDIPFFMSTRGYGIFWNTTWPQRYIFGSPDSSFYSVLAEGGNLDYYFIGGPSFKKILKRYTAITGRSPLPPKWAFGVWVNTYSEQKDVLRVCRTFREENIPADVLIIDSSWMSKNPEKRHVTLGNGESMGYDALHWDRFRYPEPEKMIAAVHGMGFKFGLWNEFHVNQDCKELYDYAVRHGYLIKNADGTINLGHRHHSGQGLAAEIDFSNPAAAHWWWTRPESQALFKMGLDVYKQDHTTFADSNVVFANGMPAEEMHNLYPLLYIQSGFNETKKLVHPRGRRGLIFTACGYAGIQRYPINWCDDIRLSEFKQAITYVENLGLSGVAFTYGLQANLKSVRAAEFGALCPIMEDFQGAPRFKGDLILKLKNAGRLEPYRFYHQLHYALLPYIYTYAHIAHETGMPIVRAMVLEFQNDPNVLDKDLQYMFGGALLVAPIVAEKKVSRSVYLPAGEWIDYWNDQVYRGPKEMAYTSPLEQIPLFVRTGSIIPMQPPMHYVGEKPVDPLILHIYPKGKSHFTLYEDDGETEAYRGGAFSETPFEVEQGQSAVKIEIGKSEGTYQGKRHQRSYLLKLHGVSRPGKVLWNGKLLTRGQEGGDQKSSAWWYDRPKHLLTVRIRPVGEKEKAEIVFEKIKSRL